MTEREEEGAASFVTVSRGFVFVSVGPQGGGEQRWPSLRIKFLETLATRGIAIEMLQFAALRLSFAIVERAAGDLRSVVRACDLAWQLVPQCSKICVMGNDIRTSAGVYYRTFAGLVERNIPLLHFSDSEATISFVVPEVQAERAEAFLRSILAQTGSSLRYDASLQRVNVNGRQCRLGARQARLLGFFIENPGRIIEAEEAARHLFGSDGKDEVAALRVHLHNLRKKIEIDPDNPRHIVTVPAEGYLFVR